MKAIWTFFILIVLLLLLDFSESACGKETKQFLECWYHAKNQLHSANQKNSYFETFSNQIKKCFIVGGCRAGKLDIEDDSEKDVKGDEKHKECVSKLRDSVKKRAEKCIQEKLDTDFELPTFVKYTTIGNFALYPLAHVIYQMLYNTTMCPATANTTNISICVNSVFDEIFSHKSCRSPFAIAIDFDNTMAQYCDSNCFSKLTNKCTETLNTTYPTICRCIFSQQESKDYDIHVTDFTKCTGKLTDEEFIREIVFSFTAYYCDEPPNDPCKESSLNDEKIKYKPMKIPKHN